MQRSAYTWIMILEAWNLHKMIIAGKYLAIYHFGNWSGDLVGWASGFACKLSTVLQQKLFTSKHWARISSLHCSTQSTCRVKATMLHEGGWPKLIAAFFHHPSCNVQCCQQINIPNNFSKNPPFLKLWFCESKEMKAIWKLQTKHVYISSIAVKLIFTLKIL